MPYKSREVQRVLERKLGFEPAFTRGDDHRNFQLKLPDMPLIVTKVSHGSGNKEIGVELEKQMARQMRIRLPFFREVMDCAKSSEEYNRQVLTDPTPPLHGRS